MDRWFRRSNNTENNSGNERRDRNNRGDRTNRRDRGDRTNRRDRGDRGDRGDRNEGSSSRRNDIMQEAYREQRYQYTGIPASELARRQLVPLERNEQEDQRQLFALEWNNLHREHATLRRGLEETFSQARQALRQDFEQQNAEVAEENSETRRDMHGYMRENPQLSARTRQRMLDEMEENIQQYEQDVAEEQEQRMNTLTENQNIRLENLTNSGQNDRARLQQDQQQRMDELVAVQTTRRQEYTEHYENVIASFRGVNEQNDDSDELSF